LSSAQTDVTASEPAAASASPGLARGIDWTGAFWVASGVPPLVLFSIGAVAATVGKPTWIVFAVSIAMGFIQSFTYAEIAGLFPHKSGGTSVYGAIAWVRYSKIVAPLSVWCNCFAWSPVLAIGSGLAAGYILTGLFAPDSLINTWQITLVDLGAVKSGLAIRINSTFILGAVILIAVKLIQDGGILRSANTTKIIGISAMIPLILIGVVPLFTGDIVMVAMDRRSVSFMYSYPNLIPLSAAAVRGVAEIIAPLAFDRIYGAWWGRNIARDAKALFGKSVERYLAAIS